MGAGGANRADNGMLARGRRPAPPPPATPEAAPDLRIPGKAAAPRDDIPIVPVPPVPLAGDRLPKSPVTPVSGQSPDPPPGPATPPDRPASTPPALDPQPARHTLQELVRLSAERYSGIKDYIARLTRREHVGGKAKPEEIMRFSFRKSPYSVHFKWIGDVGRGREVLYVMGQYENKIHTLLAAGDALFMPAGKRVALAPDSIMVRSASRHCITEAGIGAGVEHLVRALEAQERGDRRLGTVRLLPPQNRIEFPRPVETIEIVIPPGLEPDLPRGGRRLYFFDPERNLPTVIIAKDDAGVEVEYYRFDRFLINVGLDDHDFNPDRVWAPPPPSRDPSGGR
jgi:hypothetical protein